MRTQRTEKKRTRALFLVLAGTGALFGIWTIAAFTSLLAQTDWSIAEVMRQYMVATGALDEHETLVDYYTHIKGAEYIIAVSFLSLFPVYFKYVNRAKVAVKA